MAKQKPKTTTAGLKKQPDSKVNIIYLILLIAYGFITVLTPNSKALDSNGPKFLALAVLNLVCFIYLFSRKDVKSHTGNYFAFFSNGIGIAYSGLMIISLLSFFKAINVVESILHFSKIFTTFTAAYLISILFIKDKRNIFYISIAMSFLLIVDSITGFSGIQRYISGKLTNFEDIKSIYSHKNILAAAIFIKIPFALFLMVFSKKAWRILGGIGFLLAVTALFFLSTRAFYLGLFALTILLSIYFIIRFFQTHDKSQLKLMLSSLFIMLFAFMVFSATQHYLYPKNKDIFNKSVGGRLTSITAKESSTEARLNGWKRSWHVFKENPILGVGLGNWKIATLKEENFSVEGFNYQIKAHNDFIEITTETGVFGGLMFIALFILTFLAFVNALIKKYPPEWLSLFFLVAVGMFCYIFDAFFNFPQDRPEIQSLFALYIGLITAVIVLFYRENKNIRQEESTGETSFIQRYRNLFQSPAQTGVNKKNSIYFMAVLIFGLLLTVIIYILYLNYTSLKLQSLIATDIKKGKLTQSASIFLNGFPAIPNLTTTGLPIAMQKARYLIKENRNEEAIAILKNNKANPYDALSLGLMAEAFSNLNNSDSSLYYSQKMYEMKPNNFKNISFLCDLLQLKNRQKEAEVILGDFLKKIQNNKEAWLFASSFYYNSGNIQKSAAIIDTAATYFPYDSIINVRKTALNNQIMLLPYQSLYKAAKDAYNANNYNAAVRLYSELLLKLPSFTDALMNRAFSYYFLKEYAKSNQDLKQLLDEKGIKRSNLYNLRGVNFKNLKNNDEACKNFKIAADRGDQDGIENFSRFCKGK